MPKVAIIGAGISGLALGWYLQKNHDVTLYEQTDRVGGAIQTSEMNGYLFERGPRSLRGIETLQLIEELGLQSEVIGSTILDRYLYLDQKMEKVPHSPLAFLTSKLTRRHLFTFFKEAFKPKGTGEDETIYAFAKRRYNTTIAETFFDPLVTGIYGGNIEHLSLRACFPSLYQMEQQYGSLLRGLFAKKAKPSMSPFVQEMQKYPLFTFKKGLETLPQALGKRLNIQFHKKAVSIEQGTATFADETTIEADHIYAAIPYESTIPRASLAALHFGFPAMPLPIHGFGYLIPRKEREEILGVVLDSLVFPTQNKDKLCLTVMIGGDIEHLSEDQLMTRALTALEKHLGIKKTPELALCTKHIRAIPQYPPGYQRGTDNTRLGSTYSGVAINDLIKQSKGSGSCV